MAANMHNKKTHLIPDESSLLSGYLQMADINFSPFHVSIGSSGIALYK